MIIISFSLRSRSLTLDYHTLHSQSTQIIMAALAPRFYRKLWYSTTEYEQAVSKDHLCSISDQSLTIDYYNGLKNMEYRHVANESFEHSIVCFDTLYTNMIRTEPAQHPYAIGIWTTIPMCTDNGKFNQII